MRKETEGEACTLCSGMFYLGRAAPLINAYGIRSCAIASKQVCRDPKDGELCLGRMKSGESLMEVRSDADVQIVRLT